MHIFYQPDLSGEELVLSEEESKHAVRVLRLKKGDRVQLVDGKGRTAAAAILDDHPKKCVLGSWSLSEVQPAFRNYHLHIAVAPTKNSDRTEWFIEKAVETGIDEVSFLECENSERVKINAERFDKVAISAMKQSKQLWLPQFHHMVKFSDFIKSTDNDSQKLIAWCEAPAKQNLHTVIDHSKKRYTILIGPEGDFSKAEVELAMTNGFNQVSFGESRLRTETAALYVCMAVHALAAG